MTDIDAAAPRTTKERIVDAALETLKDEGFAGTSARAIARKGGFNQALIFYHFGTLADLLLAALDRTSEQRMQRYRDELGKAQTVADKLKTAMDLYREDLASGHVTVVSEMIAGSLSRPDLGPQVVARMEPWIDLVEGVMRELLAGTLFDGLISPRTAAFMVVSLYMGVDLLSHLERDDARAEALFEMAGNLAKLLLPQFDE